MARTPREIGLEFYESQIGYLTGQLITLRSTQITTEATILATEEALEGFQGRWERLLEADDNAKS